MRSNGILMHISSLSSPYGIGTMGKTAFEFADFLQTAGQAYWQLLPVCPTGYGDSPYQSFSTNAGNPYFIDLDLLCEDGLLLKEEYENILNKFEMHIPGIEHYYSSDLTNEKDFRRIKQKLTINSAPYYIIFNKEGVIVNYGTLMRPSYTGTSICIDQWLEQN